MYLWNLPKHEAPRDLVSQHHEVDPDCHEHPSISIPPALPSHCRSQFTRQFGWTFRKKAAAAVGGGSSHPTPNEIYQIALTYSAVLFPPQTLESCFQRWQIRVSRVFGKFPGYWSSPEESGPGVLPRCWKPVQDEHSCLQRCQVRNTGPQAQRTHTTT